MRDPRAWGVSERERAEPFPCDALGFASDETFFRGTDVAAPPGLVFRWLCQLRAAPYSYDLLDNFGRPSPAHLRAGLERLACGQRVMLAFRLVAFETNASLTVRLANPLLKRVMGDVAGSYRVVPSPAGARLLAKVLVRYPHGPYGRFLRRVYPYVDSFMFAEQLRRLRCYAERDATGGRQWSAAPP